MKALARMAQKSGTAAQWTAANPVLYQGEIGHEVDTGFFKIGDGATDWNTLPYSAAGGDVVGPAGATDEALAIYDGVTGKLIKNSVVTLDASGNMAGVREITMTCIDDATPHLVRVRLDSPGVYVLEIV